MASRTAMPAESAHLKRVWSDPRMRLRFTTHARQEMANDGILESDVRHVITRNGVSWVEWKRDRLWHVEGLDVDGRSIRLVLAVDTVDIIVKLVTAMAL